jgi:hypothetical protein
VDGTVLRRRDSVTVVVRLNDAGGDSVVGRTSATRIAPEAAQAGLAAITHLLPNLLSPGQRMADPSALADRNPAAVASWLQGEREYRRFNFAAALEFQRRAVAADSALAVAALRGAQAASWLGEDMSEAAALCPRWRSATWRCCRPAWPLHPRPVGLPDRPGRFGPALARPGAGRSPQWTEAHMALGEVFYHLPVGSRLGRFGGGEEFGLAAADRILPPRFHLAEIRIRRAGATAAREPSRLPRRDRGRR